MITSNEILIFVNLTWWEVGGVTTHVDLVYSSIWAGEIRTKHQNWVVCRTTTSRDVSPVLVHRILYGSSPSSQILNR